MKYQSFAEADREGDRLADQGRFADAAELMQGLYDLFPDFRAIILWNLIALYCHTKEYERSLAALRRAVESGYFYNLGWNLMDPLREMNGFQELEDVCKQRETEAQAASSMSLEVLLPVGYDGKKISPLVLLLHGDGENQDLFRGAWLPDVFLENGFITVYVQSSQVASCFGRAWTPDYTRARQDIRAAYEQVCQEYRVDPQRVLLAGFSGGAMASINAAMNDLLPMRGFLALCPHPTTGLTVENAAAAAQRRVRGYVMAGEKEDVAMLADMIAVLKEGGMETHYEVNEGIGHAYPQDLQEKVRRAIQFFLN